MTMTDENVWHEPMPWEQGHMVFEIILEVDTHQHAPTAKEIKEYLYHCVTKCNPYDVSGHIINPLVVRKS